MSNVLFLSGWNAHRGRLESLDYNQSSFRAVLVASGWNVVDKRVTDVSSVLEAFKAFDGRPLLVIYTGHGISGESFYPFICPVKDPFDLLCIGRNGETSYIFDCCNVNDGEEPLFIAAANHGAPNFYTQCLDPRQRYIVCMRRQVFGFTRGTGTVFNLGLCGVLYHYRCQTISGLCEILNGYCNAEYKAKNYVKGKRVKYVITLNGKNPSPRSPQFSESAIREKMQSMKFPKFEYPDAVQLGPASMGLELIEHLGGSFGFELEADETDDQGDETSIEMVESGDVA